MFVNSYRYLYILLLSVYSFLNISIINEDRLYLFELNPLLHFLNVFFLVALLWEGNRLIEQKMILGLNFKQPKGFVAQFMLSVLLCIILGSLSVLLMFRYLGRPLEMGYFSNLKLTLGFAFRVNLFLNIVNVVFYYATKYREKEREADQFRIKTIEAQYNALRNQVNPHFLFNSLNVLTNLVHKDADMAEDFLHKLADVYRCILKNEENSLVKLTDEIEFVDSYLYLLKIRFKEGIKITQKISQKSLHYFLPPSTLQILVENAIKHNVASADLPLEISIYSEEKFLVVENTLQQSQNTEASNGVGLSNIFKRYALLTEQKAEVSQTESRFSVKIPLLNITGHETINSRR